MEKLYYIYPSYRQTIFGMFDYILSNILNSKMAAIKNSIIAIIDSVDKIFQIILDQLMKFGLYIFEFQLKTIYVRLFNPKSGVLNLKYNTQLLWNLSIVSWITITEQVSENYLTYILPISSDL